MKITICCTDTNQQPWLAGLQAALPQAHVSIWSPSDPQADHAVVWAPPQQFLDEQPALKTLFNIGAGVDALMALRIPASTQVVRLDDAGMSVQMAEYVCHAVLRHFREFDGYAHDAAQGRWSYRKPRRKAQWPVGILGMGILGQRVARSLQAFDFKVQGWSRSAKDIPGVQTYTGAAQLADFLKTSKFLVCLLPLTPHTENILCQANLSQLPVGAYLINVARGAHLVEADLLALLDTGHLSGATLDVFRQEPLPEGHPFWAHPRITVTPHTSARTLRDESIAQIVSKIEALSQGHAIRGVVDLSRGY